MKKRYFLISLIIVILAALDQLIKYLAFRFLENKTIDLKLFELIYTQNTGAAFSILSDYTFIVIILSVMIIGLLAYSIRYLPDTRIANMGIAIILAGSIGNLIDRIRIGHVVDYINFNFWPAFNIADALICVGALIIVIQIMKNK